jgi:hypothetical protein
MCPTAAVDGNGHQEHGENGFGAVAGVAKLQTNGSEKDMNAVPHVSVGAASGAASLSGGQHAEFLSKMREACEKQNCSTKVWTLARLSAVRFAN